MRPPVQKESRCNFITSRSHLAGHQIHQSYTQWSILPHNATRDQSRRTVLKTSNIHAFAVALSDPILSDFAQLEAFYHGDCLTAGIGIAVRLFDHSSRF
jgi:hypothetical protein